MQFLKLAVVGALAMSSAGCAALSGYPTDPQPDKNLDDLRRAYFSSTSEDCYKTYTDGKTCLGIAGKDAIRDDIVLNRMHVYDMEFTVFVRDLSGGNNIVSLGSDLTSLALTGLATTTGNAATKAALAAASTGIIAANGAVDKDLFYQRTIPALVAQMEADRAKAEAAIYSGLRLSDAAYPLQRAVLDLDALNRAGSVNGAVAAITQKATDAKGHSEDLIAEYRTGDMSNSDTSVKIRAWLRASDTDARLDKLQAWWKLNAPDKLKAAPFEELMDSSKDDIESLRKKAIGDAALGIK